MTLTAFVLTIVSGLALLLMGRQLFWVYVGLVGFLLGLELTQQSIVTEVEWLPVLMGLIVGLAAALLAIVFQYIAVGLAGFVSGGYLVLAAFGVSGLEQAGLLIAVIALVGGALGAALFVLLFDPALVIISALIGANLLVSPFDIAETTAVITFAVLAVVGMIFQFLILSKSEPPARRKA